MKFKISRKYAQLKCHPDLGPIIAQLEAHLDKQENIYYAKNCAILACLAGAATGTFFPLKDAITNEAECINGLISIYLLYIIAAWFVYYFSAVSTTNSVNEEGQRRFILDRLAEFGPGAFLQTEYETFTSHGAYLERQIEEEKSNTSRHQYYQLND